MSAKVKIHLADDHKILIDGLTTLINLHPEFEISGYSLDGNNLLNKVKEEKANLLIVDINMPGKDGIAVLKEYSEGSFDFKIIVLSSYEDLKLIKEVMKLGSKAYLTKQCASENIIEAIKAVLNDEEYYCDVIRKKIFDKFSFQNVKEVKITSEILEKRLSDREIEVLKLIVSECTNKEISDALCLSLGTVETHRRNIMKKIGITSGIGLVKFAIRNNIINP